ncbi:leukocidin family pore-forming toxin [Bacillus cereus]|nr:leukocidin family pore-forming toxin [Bacillus cereus]
MKNKNILKKVALTSIGLSTSLALFSPVSSAQTTSKSEEIGKGATVYKNISILDDKAQDIKTSLEVSIIKDPNTNKQLAVISTDGSRISANSQRKNYPHEGHENGYTHADTTWASSYGIQMDLTNPNQKAQFFKISPADATKEETVSNTVGYKVGGEIQTTGPKLAGEGTWSTTTSYKQSDYETKLINNREKSIKWEIPFNITHNPDGGEYRRDSYDQPWGNQLFMRHRISNDAAKDNITPSTLMPDLAARGFSPSVIAIIAADNNSEEQTDFKVTYTKTSDRYSMLWVPNLSPIIPVSGSWLGTNEQNVSTVESNHEYAIDWKNHKLIEKK